MDCAKLATCPFFNDKMEGMDATASIFKMRYCNGTPDACARLMVSKALGGANVPSDLFPNRIERAKALIAAAPKV